MKDFTLKLKNTLTPEVFVNILKVSFIAIVCNSFFNDKNWWALFYFVIAWIQSFHTRKVEKICIKVQQKHIELYNQHLEVLERNNLLIKNVTDLVSMLPRADSFEEAKTLFAVPQIKCVNCYRLSNNVLAAVTVYNLESAEKFYNNAS